MNQWRKSIEARLELARWFLRRENRRPLFGFFKGSEYPLFRYPFSRSLPEGRPLLPGDFAVDAFAEDCEKLFEEHEACGGDLIYTACAFWGIPWLEAALGCPVFADLNTGTISSIPPDDFNSDTLCDYTEYNPWMELMIAMLDTLAERSAGRFPLGTTRMRGIADLLSALYGPECFILRIFDNPDEIKRVSGNLTEFFIMCGKTQLRHIPGFHNGIGSFYYHLWMPPGTIWHQEDAAAMLSPELYAEFIEPCDRKIMNAFEQVAIHQHPVGYLPVDKYLDMGMNVFELHIDSGGPGARELYQTHLNILAHKPLLIWGNIPERDLDWIFAKLPPCGLAVNTVVESPRQAEILWRKYVER